MRGCVIFNPHHEWEGPDISATPYGKFRCCLSLSMIITASQKKKEEKSAKTHVGKEKLYRGNLSLKWKTNFCGAPLYLIFPLCLCNILASTRKRVLNFGTLRKSRQCFFLPTSYATMTDRRRKRMMTQCKNGSGGGTVMHPRPRITFLYSRQRKIVCFAYACLWNKSFA